MTCAIYQTSKAYTNNCKTTLAKRNSWRTPNLSARDRRTLKNVVGRQHETITAEVTAELSTHLSKTVSTKALWREIHTLNIHGRTAFANPFIMEANATLRKKLYYDHTIWILYGSMVVVWSDDSLLILFRTNGRVCISQNPKLQSSMGEVPLRFGRLRASYSINVFTSWKMEFLL